MLDDQTSPAKCEEFSRFCDGGVGVRVILFVAGNYNRKS